MKKILKNLTMFLILTISTNGAFCYTLTQDELNKALYQKIKKETSALFDDFEISILNLPVDKIVTSGTQKPKIEVISQNQAFQPHSFKKVLIKDEKNNLIKMFTINVQTLVYKNCLVATNDIAFGGDINNSNSKIERKEVSKYLNKLIMDDTQNFTASRNYKKGNIILSDGIKKKAAIEKNSIVNIVFLSKKGLKVTIQGRALKEGAIGETIVVRSDKYNKIYSGVVNSSTQVTVRI